MAYIMGEMFLLVSDEHFGFEGQKKSKKNRLEKYMKLLFKITKQKWWWLSG